MTFEEVTVKFVGGKLAYVSCKRAGYDDGLYEFFVYNYGTTTVTLPTEFIDYQGGNGGNEKPISFVSEEEWESLVGQLSMLAPDGNVIVNKWKVRSQNEEAYRSQILIADGIYEGISFAENGKDIEGTYYYVVQNPEAYENMSAELSFRYYNADKVEDRELSLGDLFEDFGLVPGVFAYSDFEYNPEKGIYRCEDLETEVGTVEMHFDYVELMFENGRIACVEYCITDSGESYSYYFNFYDYGEVQIELPKSE